MSDSYPLFGKPLNQRRLTRLFGILGVILLIIAGGLWWTKIYEDPQQVFWGMLNDGLATSSVTRHVTDQSQSGVLDEYIQLELGSSNLIHSLISISNSGNAITTEGVGDPYADYQRYVSIKTGQKGSDGKPLNFSSVLGVWSKSSTASSSQTDALSHQFGQNLLGIVPIGKVSSTNRTSLMHYIRSAHVFMPDFSTVKRQKLDGRQTYVYGVMVQPQAYATLMQQFAKDVGLGQLTELDPARYQGAQSVTLQFHIDIASHALVRIVTNSAHIEAYSAYGVQTPISLPSHSISTTELQTRLANIR